MFYYPIEERYITELRVTVYKIQQREKRQVVRFSDKRVSYHVKNIKEPFENKKENSQHHDFNITKFVERVNIKYVNLRKDI